ncbi:hypothetical protein KFK09_023425 [Dendrobium nobile]|uniref:Uncharacterized protein n=1 Tax=Dendrobium nobile TaxID=94219 RepID=A0A8T3ALJ7_DENNO|nr:hypothetical protein KFK09_023425 [Dendrobium nobile]
MDFQTRISCQQWSFRPWSSADYGPPDLRRLLRSLRPPSQDNGLSNPSLLPTTILPTSVVYYSHSDLHHRTTVFLTPVSCRLRSSRPPSSITVTPTSIIGQRSF